MDGARRGRDVIEPGYHAERADHPALGLPIASHGRAVGPRHIRSELEQWCDHEVALGHARVGDHEIGRRPLLVSEEQDVQVDDARSVHRSRNAAHHLLDIFERAEKTVRGDAGRDPRDRVRETRLIGLTPRLGLDHVRDREHVGVLESADRPKRVPEVGHPIAEVAAEPDEGVHRMLLERCGTVMASFAPLPTDTGIVPAVTPHHAASEGRGRYRSRRPIASATVSACAVSATS